MKPNRPNHRVSTPCRLCGNRFESAKSRVDNCPVCQANLMVELHLRLERAREEDLKRLRLFQLRLALCRASRWIKGLDFTLGGGEGEE
jgi:hypothetical protein